MAVIAYQNRRNGAISVNSRGYREPGSDKYDASHEPTRISQELVHAALDILLDSPKPMGPVYFLKELKKRGYPCSIPTIDALSNTASPGFLIFETTGGAIGLLGVHDDVQ